MKKTTLSLTIVVKRNRGHWGLIPNGLYLDINVVHSYLIIPTARVPLFPMVKLF